MTVDNELRELIRETPVERKLRAEREQAGTEKRQPPLTDLGNAERLVSEHGKDLRFAPGIGWHSWDGRRWKRDTDGEPIRRAKQTVRAMYAEAAELDGDDRERLAKWALASESEARIRAAVKLAETERPVIVEAKQLDADPWLFNCANGTIDLRRGKLREHRREDLLTRITRVVYEPKARAELWESSLRRATGGDEELAAARPTNAAAGFGTGVVRITGDEYKDALDLSREPRRT